MWHLKVFYRHHVKKLKLITFCPDDVAAVHGRAGLVMVFREVTLIVVLLRQVHRF